MAKPSAPSTDRPELEPHRTDFRDMEPFSLQAQGLDLTFYPAGADRLAALLALIDGAHRSLRLFYYIFAMDDASVAVRDALTRAAGRGVATTLILDGFGASADDGFLRPFTAAGGKLLRFSARWNVRYLIRNHQKMAIADDRLALIGGFNVEQAYFDPPQVNGWHDLGVLVAGEAVSGLTRWYGLLERCTADPHTHFAAIRRLVREWDPGAGPVRWLVGGPTRGLSPWARSLYRDIATGSRLDMVMAYFSPRSGLVRRLGGLARRAAEAGDGVRLVLAGKSDNAATIGAARANYGRLLRRGARICEFQPCKLHMKLIVIDDVTYVGSANFDMRSLYLNLEIMLRIEDAALATRMREFIACHLPWSLEVTPALHRQRLTVWNRIRWSLSWFLVTVVDYTVARRLNLGL